jgi:Fur family transcriptional regulator, peroxide stress response regulator
MRMRISRNYALEMQGHPRTKQRELLLEIIGKSKEHVDAKRLFTLAVARDASISPATIYRSLNLFKQLGLVEEQRLGEVRCYYDAKNAPRHQHLVCSRCGKVFDFECPLGEMVDRVKQEQGFQVTKAEVYLEGYCAECSEEREKAGPAR